MSQQLVHWILLHGIQGQVAVLRIPFQQPPALQKAPDPMGDGMRQLREFLCETVYLYSLSLDCEILKLQL